MNRKGTWIDFQTGALSGDGIAASRRTLGDLVAVFENEAVRLAMPQDQIVYWVQSHTPVPEGTPGGLFFGVSNIMPGDVDGEYFMTKGHFHAKRETAEYYWCIEGKGALLLMDEAGKCWVEGLAPGSLHYIPGGVAHRLANTGDAVLRVGACWPSDAGHDYETITRTGFPARLKKVDGQPRLVPTCARKG